MTKFPPGEGQPENQAELEVKQPLTAEDLKKRRGDLEARVAVVKKQKEADMAKQLKDRESMVAEDARIVPLLEEAEGTLEYFEAQNQQGLLTDKTDLDELENLKKLVAGLQEQRDEVFKKYEAIMSNPDVYEKVWEEAHQEKRSTELKGEQESAAKEFEARINTLLDKVYRLASDREYAYKEREQKAGSAGRERQSLKKVTDKARENLGSGQFEISQLIDDIDRPESYTAYLKGLQEHRKHLGLFKGKEKAAVDYVLGQSGVFEQAQRARDAAIAASERITKLQEELYKLGDEYKTLIADSWVRQNSINSKFSIENERYGDFQDLGHKIHYGIEDALKKKSGMKYSYDGGKTWQEVKQDNYSGYNEAQTKYRQFTDITRVMEQRAGEHSWMINPAFEEGK